MSVRTHVTTITSSLQEPPVFVIGKVSGSVYVKGTADGKSIYIRIGRGSSKYHKDEELGKAYVGERFTSCFAPFVGRLTIDVD